MAGEVGQEFGGNDAGAGVDGQLQVADLLVDILHKVDNKVHQLVFKILLGVEVGDQERNVVSLDWFSSQKKQKRWHKLFVLI